VGREFTSRDKCFLACDDPAQLQAICHRLGPANVQRSFRSLGGSVALAPDRSRPGGRPPAPVEPRAARTAVRSQSDPGLRPAGPGPPLLSDVRSCPMSALTRPGSRLAMSQAAAGRGTVGPTVGPTA
jgi:hypothetical protein